MTSLKPTLKLGRLITFSKGKAAYDQEYQSGVNIIRGANAHGKSTIADFIFFILGGDNHTWKEQALECDTAIAEVSVNGFPITIRRHITQDSRQPLQFFWGPYEEASNSSTQGWEVYPYARSANKESFSQKLLSLLEIPETRGDEGSTITMHQLLRLIYVDQISPYDSLLRTENFDSSLKREAIGDLMLGLYDQTIYGDQLALQSAIKDSDAAKAEIKALRHVFTELKIETDPKKIKKEAETLASHLAKINNDIKLLNDPATQNPEITKQLSSASDGLRAQKQEYASTLDHLAAVSFEIEDSELFVKDLQSRVVAIQDSVTTRKSIGTLALEFCPVCLTSIDEPVEQNHQHCSLCKNQVGSSTHSSQALRMLSELESQLRESNELLVERRTLVEELKRKLKSLGRTIETRQSEQDADLSLIRSSRDQQLDSLFQHKGALMQRQLGLEEALKSISVLNDFENKEKKLKAEIDRLRFSIETKRKTQQSRQRLVNETVSNIAVSILNKDKDEEHFQKATKVEINWRSNNFLVNGRNNFSASSVVFARNAVHFAIFFASLKLQFMRYPRFILSDCIEDKGMVPSRSGNFQKIIVELSKQATVDHQIIFTTSMIDPSLEGTQLCVGPAYQNGKKTLNL